MRLECLVLEFGFLFSVPVVGVVKIRVNWRYTLTEEGLPLGIGVPHFPSSLIVS
ncbi:hypothetical protein DEO72_LG2g3187 [Vigna unguiculata]|uniref:Uncharacterized protein n=1 Tax=Vigna unguiculata TaxID=3917 RepID=A0A4D6L2Z6_VIGUN|nr:hypothetical protein DEO72_LG2g3187 [Vigna unguiculata]